MDLIAPYMKAVVAFASLVVIGVILLALGEREAGLPILTSAPGVSGLVAVTANKPRRKRRRGGRRAS